MRPREFFYSEQQWNRYKCAVGYANHLKDILEHGGLVFDTENETLIKGPVKILDDDKWTAINVKLTDTCTWSLLGFAYGEDGIPWIEETLKEIDERFSKFKYVRKKDIQTLIKWR